MKKKLVTKVMAFLMAILCLVGTMPAASVRAESDLNDDKENIRSAVELLYEFINESVVTDDPEYLPLFTGYSDEQTIESIKEQCVKMLSVLDSDEDYVTAYNEYNEEIDKLFVNWNIKLPSRPVLKDMIDKVKRYYKYIDRSEDINEVEAGMMWVKPEVLKELDVAFEYAKSVYAETEDDNDIVSAGDTGYYKIYNACVILEDAFNDMLENSEMKECTIDDIQKLLDGLKNVSSKEKIKIYNTDEEAKADNATYYVLKETQDSAMKAIAVIEKKLSELDKENKYQCEMTYNYAKRALNRYLNGIVSMPETDVIVTEEVFKSIMNIYAIVLDNDYLSVVLSDDEAEYGEEYTYQEAIDEYSSEYYRVKALYDNRANVACDYNQLYIDMQNALIKLRKNIKYKETTMQDLDNVLANAQMLKDQLDDTYETEEQIEQYGKKGIQYVLKSDMAELNKAIDYVLKNKNNLLEDSIEQEYEIMGDVLYLNTSMADLVSKIKIIDADNDDLNRIIKLSKEFVSGVYSAESADEIPEGKFWVTKNVLDQMKEYITKAENALNEDSITEKDKAYNALSTVFEVAKGKVQKGTAVKAAPTEDVTTDNSDSTNVTESATETVDTPQTGDTSAVYVYVLAAVLASAVLALAAKGYRKADVK